jgi:hypothetical protein
MIKNDEYFDSSAQNLCVIVTSTSRQLQMVVAHPISTEVPLEEQEEDDNAYLGCRIRILLLESYKL